MRWSLSPCLSLLLLGLAAPPALADTIRLSIPLDCEIGNSCFIQNHVDVDLTSGAKDYRCGGQIYDGHKGTDFRLLSTQNAARGVPVHAAARGIVKGVRDGMLDRLIANDVESVRGRECGNGIVIDHGGGWETQYCHLRRGSVAVRKGQRIGRSEPLGLIGYSGKAQFAHLHFAVRYNGQVIDPFKGDSPAVACKKRQANSLWESKASTALSYKNGQLIEGGFSDRPVGPKDLETGKTASYSVTARSPLLVFYTRFINLLEGDTMRLVLSGPAGEIARSMTKPLVRSKAHYVAYVGRKRRGQNWPKGRYRGRVQHIRLGKIVLEWEVEYVIP